jgi:dipicolinate synthase subunit B
MSDNAVKKNRFCNIEDFIADVEEICGNKVVTTIADAEKLSANKGIVASLILPCTGNTIAKLAGAVNDTCVTMTVKALLRNNKPCVIGVSTNDALSGNACNIGLLLNRRGHFFVPFAQDDPIGKPYSLVCDFGQVVQTLDSAIKRLQIQPIIAYNK